MTDEQFEKLPLLFQQIIVNNRRINSLFPQSVIPFEDAKKLILTRRSLKKDADRLYCPLKTSGGPAHA